MRVCKSLSELRNMNRVACPQQSPSNAALEFAMGCGVVVGTPFGSASSRQRLAASSAQCPRVEEPLEGRSVENAQTSGLARALYSKSLFRLDLTTVDVLSDSSGRSLESIHIVFEDVERASESLKESCIYEEETPFQPQRPSGAAIPIPMAPGQLTQAFRDAAASPAFPHSIARSAPVPVPRQSLPSGSVPIRAPVNDADIFIPPHLLADHTYSHDPMRKGRRDGLRGLSSLRARNAVLSQLGYFDGMPEIHPPSTSVEHVSATEPCP